MKDNTKEREIHCFNCTTREGSKLPKEYQGTELKSIRGVNLCPRCKCPEVAYLDASFTPSYGYNNTTKEK